MRSAATIKWVGLALLGILIAAAVSVAASRLASRQIGLASEPITAGDALAPQAIRQPRPPEAGSTAPATTTTTAPATTTTTAPTPPATTTIGPPPEPNVAVPPSTTPAPATSHDGGDDGAGGGGGGTGGGGHGADD